MENLDIGQDRESALLQGGFLLANKLCGSSSLSNLQKGDWLTVGQPVVKIIQEISQQAKLSNRSADCWIKKVICVVWLKLLGREMGEDIERDWRENPFFLIQNALPDVNSVVLLELVKSAGGAQIFGQLLLRLPQAHVCAELGRLARHATESPSSEDDVRLFVEVCWELWAGQAQGKVGEGDDLERMFASQFDRLSSSELSGSSESGDSSRAAKRFKSDPDATERPASPLPAASSATDILSVLLHGLRDMRSHVSTPDLCHQALSVSLDAFYTSFLMDQAIPLSSQQKLHFLSRAVSIRERSGEELSAALLRDAQRDLRTSHTLSRFRPCLMTLNQALHILAELTQFWNDAGLLKASADTGPSYHTLRLEGSVRRTLDALAALVAPGTVSEAEDQQTLTDVKNLLREILGSLPLSDAESNPEVNARVAVAFIDHRLEDYEDFAVVFATEEAWAISYSLWADCLERNKEVFRQHELVMKLVSTLFAKSRAANADVTQLRKLTKAITDIFSELSLPDKNIALAAMLRLSNRGLCGGESLPSAVTDGFMQELNTAFNCIIQGGSRASSATGDRSLTLAVALVARVAFQNPEATLKRCCHSAVFNKGAFSLMAKILQQLPGLRGEGGSGEAARDRTLLCSCLQETIDGKVLSADERQQLLRFLVLLMTPVLEAEEEEAGRSFLSLQEVVCTFVLPHLSTMEPGPISLDCSLQLLHGALCLNVQAPSSSSTHWLLDCSPFPLLYTLTQLLSQATRCWDQPPKGNVSLSMETKELLVSTVTALAKVVGQEVASAPGTWSRALSWLYSKGTELDWTVRFHLKPVWGEHFKNEVPLSLLAVCDLEEQEWSGLDLPSYGQGTGLLAWMECCTVSDVLSSTMLSHLSLDQRRPDHVNMFSKGLLVATAQILPWCCPSEWTRILAALRELLRTGRLHVPYSLEYVDYLPLLDLRGFSCELRLSVFLLRVLQLLCGSSCSDWLPVQGWAHVGLLYEQAVRETLEALRAKLVAAGDAPKTPEAAAVTWSVGPPKEKEVGTAPSQEVLFVLSQLFCHIQHAQVMMPGGQNEALFRCALEILNNYEAVMATHPECTTQLESDNTRHFFTTITDNLESQEMKAALHLKISQLKLAAA